MRKCIVCNTELTNQDRLMTCKNMPASAQNIPALEELDNEMGVNLCLYQCPCCSLIQFDCEPVSYYRDVIRAGGYTKTMAELRHSQYHNFIRKCNLEGKKIIEVGCGQGEFLEMLGEFPVCGFGIEHKADLVKKAQDKGLNVWEAFAEDEETVIDNGPFDAFLSFNFLEHQPNPNGMLQCIRRNLTDDGVGLITVPNFDYILANDAFYELLRDHIANYTLESLSFLLMKNGFSIIETSIVNKDTISVIVRKRTKTDVSGLKDNFNKLYLEINQFVDARISKGKKIAVWGASRQGFTTLSTMGIADKISYIIDSAPFKQGKYSPASHIKIVSPDHYYSDPVDCIIIIAPGYTDEIKNVIRDRYADAVEIAAIRGADIGLVD